MAVDFAGFSIREYTVKMRAVDAVKCWPFSVEQEEEIKKEQLQALLPPIPVPKFRWWFHELHKETHANATTTTTTTNTTQHDHDDDDDSCRRIIVEEKMEMVCPVCGNFAAATVNAVNAHIDSCLAHSQRQERRNLRMAMKAKSKTPKKRSIVEIFAVCPQIEKSGREDKFREHLAVQRGQHQQYHKKKIVRKVAFVNKLVMEQKKNKKKRKKHKSKMKGSIANKENTHKLDLPTPVNCIRQMNGSLCNKEFAKQKKHEDQSSKFIAKQQKRVIPIRGILKNSRKCIPLQNSSIYSTSDDSQPNCCYIQHLEKHVRFSGKDDILGGPRKESFHYSDPNVCNANVYAFASQSENDRSIESDKELATMEVNGGDGDAYVGTGNGTGLQSMISKKQLPDIHDHVNSKFLSQHVTSIEKQQRMSDKPLIQLLQNDNLQMRNQGYKSAPLNCNYAGVWRALPTAEEGNNPCGSAQSCGSISGASNPGGKFIDYLEDHTQGVAAVGSFDGTRTFTQPSSSDFTLTKDENKRVSFVSQSAIEGLTSQSSQYQPFCHLPSREFVGPEWKQRIVAWRERCIGEEFCGLPLNSRGELIQVSSSGRVAYNQPKQSTVISSSSSIPVHNPLLPRSLGDIFKKNCIERTVSDDQFLPIIQKNPNVDLPAGFGITDFPSNGRAGVFSPYERGINNTVYPLDSDQNLMNNTLGRCRQYDQLKNPKGNEMTHLQENLDNVMLKTTQPTMRLMGKDVAIGRSSTEMQRLGNGKIWMDKEIIQEHCHASSALDNSFLKTHIQQDKILHPAFGRPEGTIPQPFEIQSNQASQSNFLMGVSESRLSHPCLNRNPNSFFRNGNLGFNGNSGPQLSSCAYPLSLPTVLCEAANLHEPSLSAAETLRFRSQIPFLSFDKGQHMDWRPVEIPYQKNLPHATSSSFDFPFLHPNYSERIQSSSVPSSSKNPPPWLLHAKTQIKPPTTLSQTFSDVTGEYHPRTTGATFVNAPALHNSLVISYPRIPVIPNLHLTASCDPEVFVQPPLVPFIPVTDQNSSVNMGYRNGIKVTDRKKLNAFAVGLPDPCQKPKKRPAANADYLVRPTKMPNLTVEDFSVMKELTREDLGCEIWKAGETHELSSEGDKAMDVGCGPNDTLKDGLTTSQVIETSKVDGTAKSGPIKLSAGVKHILKPSKNMDQVDSRLIHSTIPFAAITDSSNFVDSQKKSTKIYKF